MHAFVLLPYLVTAVLDRNAFATLANKEAEKQSCLDHKEGIYNALSLYVQRAT